MSEIKTEVFMFRLHGFAKRESKCTMKSWRHNGVVCAVAIERNDNQGPSVTNCAEELWTEWCNWNEYDISAVRKFEHFPDGITPDSVDGVNISFHGNALRASWYPVTEKGFEEMTGKTFSEVLKY